MTQVAFRAPMCFAFVKESNSIEGIFRNPTREELEATERFLHTRTMNLDAIVALQAVYAPNCPLRLAEGMDVFVGRYTPPPGGPKILDDLYRIIDYANNIQTKPWETHVLFEQLHPFMDGNGRTGRTLWAWKMYSCGLDPFNLSFLHKFYYQTLDYHSYEEENLFSDSSTFLSWNP